MGCTLLRKQSLCDEVTFLCDEESPKDVLVDGAPETKNTMRYYLSQQELLSLGSCNWIYFSVGVSCKHAPLVNHRSSRDACCLFFQLLNMWDFCVFKKVVDHSFYARKKKQVEERD